MKLSIIIVNYNVQFFLSQCLRSIEESEGIYISQYNKDRRDGDIDTEVYVVDNNSVDGSVDMLKTKYPWVKLIENKENLGFSKANNQAIRKGDSRYVLLLNPDTVLEADTLRKTVAFMDEHEDAGGLGVKMLDGEGNFQKESKRGMPTPGVSFYKIIGLCHLFPHSKRFARYYMGHLSEDEVQEVEILSGAYMLMRREALDKVGLLDETFFMYGEDVDLSYRILQGGYKNYYYPHTRIIHYKGESTKKGSLNYIMIFYKAMEIFVEKHFGGGKAKIYSKIIKMAIWGRASLAMVNRILKWVLLPLLDFFLGYYLLRFMADQWSVLHFESARHFPDIYKDFVLWLYVALYVGWNFVLKAYKNPISFKRLGWAYLLGAVSLLVLFGLLGEAWAYSRFMIVAGSLLCFVSAVLYRYIFSKLMPSTVQILSRKTQKYLLVGTDAELSQIPAVFRQQQIASKNVFYLKIDKASEYILEQVKVHKITEVVFCANDTTFATIIELISQLKGMEVNCSILSPEGDTMLSGRWKKN